MSKKMSSPKVSKSGFRQNMICYHTAVKCNKLYDPTLHKFLFIKTI
jgi:hypothetical protein